MALQTRIANGDMEFTEEFTRALTIMEGGKKNLFITGRAGTGKSTLLSYFKSITTKKIAVLAPTGIAALNVGGQTIHSFCRFKPDITLENVNKLTGVPYSAINMYRSIETIIIDEISMVRADLLDCLDKFMRLNGPNRDLVFGGVQVIFVGDLYQLPPVVTGEEQEIFSGHYKSPYFFDSKVFDELKLEFIELRKYFRHSDPKFIGILNAIRNNTASDEDLRKINERFDASLGSVFAENMYITLTSTNNLADSINNRHLDLIPKKLHLYNASITGKFNKNAHPADEVLKMKEDSQVMMLNNDSQKRWVNGSLARVVSVQRGIEGDDKIIVELSDGTDAEVLPHTWKTSKLSYDQSNNKIVSTDMGSFTQYPLMLAWAVTIHKSQGKTFDNVIIDVGDGTFAHGQLYVALSRCTALEGIVLSKKILMKHIITDKRIAEFHKEHFS